MESARRATAADVAILAELVSQAIDELRPTRGGEIWSRSAARELPAGPALAEALGSPDHLVLVGEVDGTPVGYAAARIETLRDAGRLAILDDIYVDAGARGIGVGEAMMEQVLDWAQAAGCVGIDSVALPGNRATKNFFESNGLVARAIVVHRSFTGADEEPSAP